MDLKRISRNTANELLAEPGVEKVDDLSKLLEGSGDAVYALPDGKALVVPRSGRCFLWASVNRLRKNLAFRGPQTHVLDTVFTAGPDFVSQIDSNIKKLAELAKLSSKELDFSIDSLKRLDKKVFTKNNTVGWYSEEGFAPLCAYFGEVLRRQIGGKWEIKLGGDKKTWEPWLVNTKMGDVEIYTSLVRQLEGSPGSSLHATVICFETMYLPPEKNPRALSIPPEGPPESVVSPGCPHVIQSIQQKKN